MATQQQIDAGFNAFCAAGDMGLSIYQQIAEAIKAAEQAAWQPIETALFEKQETDSKGNTWFITPELLLKNQNQRWVGTQMKVYVNELKEERLIPFAHDNSTHWRPLSDAPTDINEKDLK